jgi:hypothetical protein
MAENAKIIFLHMEETERSEWGREMHSYIGTLISDRFILHD